MQRAIVAAVLALVVLVWPAQAQLFPAPTGGDQPVAPVERTLVDGTLYVNPPTQEGLCMVLGAGQLSVTTRRVNDAITPRSATFRFYSFMVDPDAHMEIPIGGQDATATIHLNGADRYCWSVSIDAPETRNMSMAERGAFIQVIAVKMTFAPQ